MRNIKGRIRRIVSLLEELRSYEIYKEHLVAKLDTLFSDYQKGKFPHSEYKKRELILLEGKSRKEWMSYYENYAYSLLKQIEEQNYEIFYEAYENKDYEKIVPVGKPHPKEEPSAAKKAKEDEAFEKLASLEKEAQEKIGDIRRKEEERIAKKEEGPLKVPLPKPGAKVRISKNLQKGKNIGVGGTFGLEFIKTLLKRFTKKTNVKDRKTILDLKLKSRDDTPLFEKPSPGGFSSSVIAEEARRIKSILERRKTDRMYQPSFFGALANVMIKRVSFFLLDTFPDLFKKLYNGLRLANVKMLSNTYVNIMVLFFFLSFLVSVPGGFFFFAKRSADFLDVIVKTIFTALIAGAAVFIGFYSYPFAKIKDRNRNINSNLPFAINHMAAVASSGVPPTRMFQLIADSTEYGEVSIEVAKIVEYIELFGYDFLTAVKSVASISPSPAFKDFLEGMVSTIESGGDIKEYLSQKAAEAMLNYELERQKYEESISTYSDVYTGILIAAPLFFVTALSMMSMLGGMAAGLDVNVITVVGTYVIVPLLNVGFLFFLNMTQPEA